MARTTAGVSFDLVTTAATTVVDGLGAQAPLGFILTVPSAINDGVSTANAGDQEWIYVRNATGAQWVAGTIVMRELGALDYDCQIAALDTETARVVGVSQHTIAAGSFGFILRKGRGLVLADTGGFTADNGLVQGNVVTGRADNRGAVTTHCFGVALATTAATATGAAMINCPG